MNLIVVFTLLYEDRIHFSILYSINLIFSVFFCLFVCCSHCLALCIIIYFTTGKELVSILFLKCDSEKNSCISS